MKSANIVPRLIAQPLQKQTVRQENFSPNVNTKAEMYFYAHNNQPCNNGLKVPRYCWVNSLFSIILGKYLLFLSAVLFGLL